MGNATGVIKCMNYEDQLFNLMVQNLMAKKVEGLEKIGFSPEEASRFTSLLFRSAENKVILSKEEEYKLAGYEKKYKKLKSERNIADDKIKFQELGFLEKDAEKFAFLVESYMNGKSAKNITKSLLEYLKLYKELLFKLSPDAAIDFFSEQANKIEKIENELAERKKTFDF